MQYTTNYNLKKPEGSDPVNIQDFNDNADSLDTELKKRVAVTGGDISNTKIATADNITTEFPVPSAGDTPKAFLGKMKKFAEDFKNLKTGLLTVGMLVNNCTTNNANLPLSAAQGKVLMDLYTQLNGELKVVYSSAVSMIGTKTDECGYKTAEIMVPDGYEAILYSIVCGDISNSNGLSLSILAVMGGCAYFNYYCHASITGKCNVSVCALCKRL